MNKNDLTRRRKVGRWAVPLLSVAAAAVLLPLNMGGCGTGDVGGLGQAVTSVTGNVTGLGGGGGGGGTNYVGVGLAGIKGVQALTMGDPQERALGQSVAVNLTNKYRLVQDETLNRYVTMVAQVLLNQSNAGGDVCVGILDTDAVNAYSGPNGYVIITRGALRQIRMSPSSPASSDTRSSTSSNGTAWTSAKQGSSDRQSSRARRPGCPAIPSSSHRCLAPSLTAS